MDEAFEQSTGIEAGTPILHRADKTVDEEVLAFMLWRLRSRQAVASSLMDEAYILREWKEWCAGRKRNWERPEDAWLREWRDSMHAAGECDGPQPPRVARKISVVFNFYKGLPTAYPWDARNQLRRRMVAEPGKAAATGAGMLTCAKIDGEIIWSEAEWVDPSHTPRPIPGEDDVVEILRRLGTARPDPSRTCGDDSAELRAARNRFIGRCMAHAGLRSAEAAGFGLRALWRALWTAKVLPAGSLRGDWRRLDDLAADHDALQAILNRLVARTAAEGPWLFIGVLGKGRRARQVQFPLDLVRDLLTTGLEIRSRQISHWRARGWAGMPPPELFLSGKGPQALKPGSVADIIAEAFNQPTRKEGSAHRLRAHYCTVTAIRILGEEVAANGNVVCEAVTRTALDRIADAIGNRRFSTAAKHYLGRAQAYWGKSSATPLSDAARVFGEVVDGMSLEARELGWRVLSRLATGGAEDVFAVTLSKVMERVDAMPIGSQKGL